MTTTTVVQPSSSPALPTSFSNGRAQTINQIYRAASPGVVDITSSSTARHSGGGSSASVSGRQQTEGEGAGVVLRQARATSSPTSTSWPARLRDGPLPGRRQRAGEGARHRPVDRRGGDPASTSSLGAAPDRVRELERRPGRRPGGRDRQPVRPARDDHRRNRQRGRPQHHRAEQLHDPRRDPDRRGDQPGQLGRTAAGRRRSGARSQRPDPDQLSGRRARRRRVRDPGQHRRAGRQRRSSPASKVEHPYVGVVPEPDASTGGAEIAQVDLPADRRRLAGGQGRPAGGRRDHRGQRQRSVDLGNQFIATIDATTSPAQR